MRPLLLLLLTVLPLCALEVPSWVLQGALGVESSSFYDETGAIQYINRKRGRHGERGPWQMTRAVFNEVKHPGESFSDLATDPEFAERVFIRRMVSLRSRLGSWQSAVRAYNAGVTGAINGRGYEYLNDVRQWAASRGLSFNQ